MKIEKITITNIKSFKKVEFLCNESFNIIIGENNIGKTSIFDSLLLWKMAYLELITVKGKTFYKKTNWNSMNINFNKLLIFRIVNAANIFNDTSLEASISLVIKDEGKRFDLEIELDIPSIKDSYIRFKNQNKHSDFVEFANHCAAKGINLRDVAEISITNPIANIVKNETFLNRAMIMKETYLGRSFQVLRNKILYTRENEKFEYLESRLNNIFNKVYKIRYKNRSRDDDEFISITIQQNDGVEIDLGLVGSGLLHIIEILVSIYIKNRESKGFHLLLLDEPDSHIHADIQVKLVDEIRNYENVQVFLVTHNDRLIEKAQEGELFYINENVKNLGLLISATLEEYQIIKNDLSSLYSQLDKDKPMIITEGKTDWKHFKAALEYFKNKGKFESLDIEFLEYENEMEMGDSQLKILLKEISKVPRQNKVIGIFDCDTLIGKSYENIDNQVLLNNVFAITIPTPSFREYHTGICIEFLYKDEDLKKEDQNSRRIYLSEEFSEKGRLLADKRIVVINADKIKKYTNKEKSLIIDKDVIDLDDNSLALTKSDFAKNVLEKIEPFDNMSFKGFKKMFEKIEQIIG